MYFFFNTDFPAISEIAYASDNKTVDAASAPRPNGNEGKCRKKCILPWQKRIFDGFCANYGNSRGLCINSNWWKPSLSNENRKLLYGTLSHDFDFPTFPHKRMASLMRTRFRMISSISASVPFLPYSCCWQCTIWQMNFIRVKRRQTVGIVIASGIARILWNKLNVNLFSWIDSGSYLPPSVCFPQHRERQKHKSAEIQRNRWLNTSC